MIERLPERVRTRSVAEAVTSPAALLLAGGAMSAAILAGLPLAAAAVAGVAGWAARVAFAIPRQPKEERIDVRSIRDPWRHFVRDALDAQARFRQAVARCRPGPLQERLQAVGRRLDDGVRECWRIARRGDVLEDAIDQLDIEGVHAELDALRRERPGPARDRTEAALQAQLASGERLVSVARDARDRLRLLNAQLDEAVARAVELSINAADTSAFSPLSADVDSLVSELESLRQALEETTGGPGATGLATA